LKFWLPFCSCTITYVTLPMFYFTLLLQSHACECTKLCYWAICLDEFNLWKTEKYGLNTAIWCLVQGLSWIEKVMMPSQYYSTNNGDFDDWQTCWSFDIWQSDCTGQSSPFDSLQTKSKTPLLLMNKSPGFETR
jgi:hypothetical protein